MSANLNEKEVGGGIFILCQQYLVTEATQLISDKMLYILLGINLKQDKSN